jgi:hypothetical protein
MENRIHSQITPFRICSGKDGSVQASHWVGLQCSSLTYHSINTVCLHRATNIEYMNVKVKFALYQAPKAQRGSKAIALFICDLGPRRGWVVSTTLRSLYPRKRPGVYLLYRRLGGPPDRSELVQKILLPPEFDPRTVQPVASHYTGWAKPALESMHVILKIYGVAKWNRGIKSKSNSK